jgi:hypothetical protein
VDTDTPWHDVLQHYASDVDVPDARVEGVLAAVSTEIGRRRHRAIARTVAASAAALLLVVALGCLVLPKSSHTAPTSAASTTAATAAEPPSGMTLDRMVADLTRVLSTSGHVSDARTADTPNGLIVDLLYDDGHGQVAIEAAYTPASSPVAGPIAQTCDSTCEIHPQPNGSTLRVTEQGTVDRQWGATLGHPDGSKVELVEWNTSEPKGRVIVRPEPPLTSQQLGDIVLRLGW